MQLTGNDTIRILVSTDNHVGYEERDPIRKNDSWKTFEEVMVLAKRHDVDMVVLAGDLFHENKPSRQAMYQVTRSLRANCLGNKPCELEILSDKTEAFEGTFDHANYEDEDINVAIPVFSIHGNHDDPTGEGHLAALDLLQVGGLVNYYGRTHESDNIQIKPVLLQKGRTKLAMYGMSNVRDERLFRTFRDGKVKFFQPSQQKSDWFNLMSVHQNRHAYTETGYLPENFLPNWMDLVIWGHEHESLIYPKPNAETGFDVIQPGSTVATSLVEAEAKPKHVCILSITGREYKSQPIRLKSVRPFKIRDVVLAEDPVTKKLAKKEDNRGEVIDRLIAIVEELIEEANSEWQETQGEAESEEDVDPPLPLIRLRVETTAPEGGAFNCENPQRFSKRFVDKVANTTDVIQLWRKKKTATRNTTQGVELPKNFVLHSIAPDAIDFGKLVREFLTAQPLTMLPQNSFRDAVKQFVDKDDKHAMQEFIDSNVRTQVKHLLSLDEENEEEDMQVELEANRARLEELFAKGHRKRYGRRIRQKPAEWNSDVEGEWNSDQSGAIEFTDVEDDQASDDDDDDRMSVVSATPAPRGRGRTNGTTRTPAAKKMTTRTTRAAPASKTAQPAKSTRGRKKQAVEEDEDEDEDNDGDVVVDDADDADDQNDSQLFPLFVRSQQACKIPAPKTKAAPAKKAPAKKAPAKKAAPPARSQVSLRSGTGVSSRSRNVEEISDDIEDDDDNEDAFEPVPAPKKGRAKR